MCYWYCFVPQFIIPMMFGGLAALLECADWAINFLWFVLVVLHLPTYLQSWALLLVFGVGVHIICADSAKRLKFRRRRLPYWLVRRCRDRSWRFKHKPPMLDELCLSVSVLRATRQAGAVLGQSHAVFGQQVENACCSWTDTCCSRTDRCWCCSWTDSREGVLFFWTGPVFGVEAYWRSTRGSRSTTIGFLGAVVAPH